MNNKINYTSKIWKAGGSLVVTIDSLIIKKLKLEKGDVIEVTISKVSQVPNIITLRCPCGDVFNVKEDASVIDCPKCDRVIKNSDFNKFKIELDENLKEIS